MIQDISLSPFIEVAPQENEQTSEIGPAEVKKPTYRQSYRKASHINRWLYIYVNKLIRSINNNRGKMDDEFVEDMNLEENETEKINE